MSRRLGLTGSIFVAFLCFGMATLSVPILITQPRVVLAADSGSSGDHVDKPTAETKSDHDAPTTDKAAPHADTAEDAASSTNTSAKTPEEAAARRKAENEDYEFYKSLADTIDQVERNYVKTDRSPRIDGSRHQRRAQQARSVFQLHQPRRNQRLPHLGRKPIRRHRHPNHPRRWANQSQQPAGRHAGLQSGRDGGRSDSEHRRPIRPAA